METIFIPPSITWWLIFLMAITPFIPLVIGLVKQKDASQTSLTWILYLIQDGITMFSGAKVRINVDPMVFGFTIGSFLMASILLYQRRYAVWTKVETITSILIIICIAVWFSSGPYLAFIASILSESIIGIYLIIRTFKNPVVKYNLSGYVIFLLISILSVFFSKTWAIQEVGFAITETILSFVILIPLFKKMWEERKPLA
jgi:hypothetical protein